ncbi:DBH-like monooxygenase protein 1 homolog [Anneissia japonica]|uniref:DBH-like monooxygenase protein 1 homolog n=1 Tax=Anneissia japonica TaxID=1529436 RepID=UPI001425813C|nr:DBH-like monooxygenase protein 1 homolog [Anneissia japonica]
MIKNRVKTIFVISLLVAFVNTKNSIDETHEVLLNEEFDFMFKWRVDREDILIEMSANSLGYVAVGFSPNGGMPGSDIVVGWVKDDEAFLSDRHGKTNSMPDVDVSSDYDILYGFEEGGRTTIGFKRTLNTCDGDDYVINSDTARVIWAVNEMDPEDTDNLIYHGPSRGVRSVVLLNAPEKSITLPEDVASFELLMPNVTVPSDSDTTYWCTSFAVPAFDNPVHVVRFETIVQEGHESLVHHLIAYSCNSKNVWSGICFRNNMPDDFWSCRRMIYAWAVGGGPLDFPDHAGLSLGRGNDSTIILIEMHYDNPGHSADFHDNSGVRVYYTPTLRQYEAEVWTIGEEVSPLQSIPPNEKAFKTFGFCFGDCTKQVLEEDIKIIAVALHGHLAATKISLQHYRNGSLIDDLARDDNYDFNLQEFRYFETEKVFKPGDEFVVTCVYKTVGRENITVGGISTRQEMCMAFVVYYPKQSKAGACLSSPDISAFFNTFNISGYICPQCMIDTLGSVEPSVLRDGLRQVSYEGKRINYCRNYEGDNIGDVQLYDFPAWFSENDRVVKKGVCTMPTNGSVSRKFMSLSLSITLLLSCKLTL